ncbi:MAG TPA: hypothetical protein VJ972_03990, partial [Anaerolineales bacterium]|nr:hypothetical protein [Anaerolineales bacterium]
PIELAWFHGLYGEINHSIELAEQALDNTIKKMPDWKSPALANLIRLNLMAGNVDAAEKIAGSEQLNPIMAVIRSRYLAIINLAYIELELAKNNFKDALSRCDVLLDEIIKLTWIHHPEILCRKADALVGLGRLDEALQALTEACSRAEKLDLKLHLLDALARMADINSQLGNQNEAETNRKQARNIVDLIAERLEKIDLKDSFLKQPRVQKLMRE